MRTVRRRARQAQPQLQQQLQQQLQIFPSAHWLFHHPLESSLPMDEFLAGHALLLGYPDPTPYVSGAGDPPAAAAAATTTTGASTQRPLFISLTQPHFLYSRALK
jgi:hypothetical protein